MTSVEQAPSQRPKTNSALFISALEHRAYTGAHVQRLEMEIHHSRAYGSSPLVGKLTMVPDKRGEIMLFFRNIQTDGRFSELASWNAIVNSSGVMFAKRIEKDELDRMLGELVDTESSDRPVLQVCTAVLDLNEKTPPISTLHVGAVTPFFKMEE